MRDRAGETTTKKKKKQEPAPRTGPKEGQAGSWKPRSFLASAELPPRARSEVRSVPLHANLPSPATVSGGQIASYHTCISGPRAGLQKAKRSGKNELATTVDWQTDWGPQPVSFPAVFWLTDSVFPSSSSPTIVAPNWREICYCG
jgi:hypothetical protein